MEFNNLVEGILQSLNETKEAPDGYYYTEKGNLRKGNPASDGRGGPKYASDPTDRKNYGPREDNEEVTVVNVPEIYRKTLRGELKKLAIPHTFSVDSVEVGVDDVADVKTALANLKGSRARIGDKAEEDAEYRGRKVSLNKPTRGDVKKFKVYVKDPKSGNVKKVNFGHGGTSAKRKGEKTMKIRKSNPKARKSFRARHNCDNPGPKTKARYWSCKKW
jgi:hypothetical protein